MMVGEKKLPRSQLSVCDHEGRTAVHYAALKGDAATLRAFVDLGHLMPEELRPGNGEGGKRCCEVREGPQRPAAAPHRGRQRLRTLPGRLGASALNGRADRSLCEVNDCKLGSSALARPDGDGRTVAHQAAARPDAPLLRHLVEACGLDKATLHLADHWHRTPAHDAAAMDAPEVLQLLQDYGAPLHLPMGPMEPQIGAVAIVNQSSEVVAYLGNSRAALSVRNPTYMGLYGCWTAVRLSPGPRTLRGPAPAHALRVREGHQGPGDRGTGALRPGAHAPGAGREDGPQEGLAYKNRME